MNRKKPLLSVQPRRGRSRRRVKSSRMSPLLLPVVEEEGSRSSLRPPRLSRVSLRALLPKRSLRGGGGEVRRHLRRLAPLVLPGVTPPLLKTTRPRRSPPRMTKKRQVLNLPATYHWRENASVLGLIRNPTGPLPGAQPYKVSHLNVGGQSASVHSLVLSGI